MGREHRISRDARLRKTRDRREARIPPAVPVRTRKVAVSTNHAILGIDVGEDFFDLALLAPDRSSLRYRRVALAGITESAVDSIAAKIADAIGEMRGPALAFVDSPRAPRDLDCSATPMRPRIGDFRGRMIDSALRELIRARAIAVALSMFPTPRVEYFLRCARSPGCKPHLRTIADELLVCSRIRAVEFAPVSGGAIFTRFMLAGFALYPALERLGIRAWECFPDLQFRLYSEGAALPPKRSRSEALRVRREICAGLARSLAVESFEPPRTLDQADAAILALGAAAGVVFELRFPPEGRFVLALPSDAVGCA